MTGTAIDLEKPLFYNNPFGLRFEIGTADLEIWLDFDRGILNQEYFKIAVNRAISIFETAFAQHHQIAVVYQISSDGRQRIHANHYLFKQVRDLVDRQVTFSKRRDLYRDDPDNLRFQSECWRRVVISELRVQDINYENILTALTNHDFSRRRKPSMQGDCFIINQDTGVVLNLYDDQGMDVIAPQQAALEPLYQKHNDWILDTNRAEIEATFQA